MMIIYFGAHMKISNGIENVPEAISNINGNTFQIFVKSPRTWKSPNIDNSTVNTFKKNMKRYSISMDKILVHSNYLINLASPKEDTWEKSIKSMVEEINAVQKLGIKHYNIHCGSHLGKGEDYALNRIVEALNEVYNSVDLNLNICLENSSEKGNNFGYKLEQIGKIFESYKHNEYLSFVYDTCHGFDSNYDLRNEEDVDILLKKMDDNFGYNNLKFIHLNDSKSKLNEGKDRHANIGKGYIGEKGIRNIINNQKLKEIPFILETPGDDDTHKNEIKKLNELLK
ncbi:MAG: deoxyribonuclease IV [Thermotogota bacterium]